MPWCERCDRFLSPNTVQTDGSCPSCGRPVDPGRAGATSHLDRTRTDVSHDVDGREEEEVPRVPWHFWVMVGGVILYLGWRLIEAAEWVFQNWL